jgi:hypothetical protein
MKTNRQHPAMLEPNFSGAFLVKTFSWHPAFLSRHENLFMADM